MSSPASVIKLICANNGSMDYNDLISSFGFSDFFPGALYDSVEKTVEDSKMFATVLLNGQKTVICRSPLRLCKAKDCHGCNNLHLCKFFLFGDCKYGRGRRGCRFSHNLTTEQNAIVLQKYGLSQLDRSELCILLIQSDNTLLPAVCHSYNNGTGTYGRCQDGESCKRMHICEKYLRGPCQCPRAHDFNEPHPLKTLQDRGVPQVLMSSIKALYTNIEALRDLNKVKSPQQNGGTKAGESSGQKLNSRAQQTANANATVNRGQGKNNSSQSSAEKTEICMYFVKGSCKFGDSCKKEHSKLPYKWEIQRVHGWVAVSDNEGIERDYCNPAKTCSSGIDFDTMSFGSLTVRRLSTVSSVVQPHFILTTNWIWYWEDEYGKWTQYASSNGSHNAASITSEELEQKFMQDNTATVDFTAGSQSYTLSFQDMIQTNKRYGTKKVVRRRPEFVSSADAQTIKTRKIVPRQNDFKTLPSHWDKALTPETGYKRVQLQSSSSEYQKIQNLFSATMRGISITKIERIQNKALWEVFQWQKDLMKKNNSGRNVEEKQLFHGTESRYIDAICFNNFDWRICGTHGTAYGKGSYFARDAKYSHNYTGNSMTRSMFVCRILVGDYTVGDSSYVRPPSKDGGDTIFYDSCVNDQYNPSIFVVFEKYQIYPEYLISYSETSQTLSNYYPSRAVPAAVQAPRPAPVQAPRPAPPQQPTYYPPSYTYSQSQHSPISISAQRSLSSRYSARSPSPKKSDGCVIC